MTHTDDEIMKAFAICKSFDPNGDCSYCPFNKGTHDISCIEELTQATFDLLYRQREEVSNLSIELKAMRGAEKAYEAEIERLGKIRVELSKEIERLREENDEKFIKWKVLAEKTEQRYSELYEEAKEVVKSEARKETAERIFEKIFYFINLYKKGHFSEKSLFEYIAEIEKEYRESECE